MNFYTFFDEVSDYITEFDSKNLNDSYTVDVLPQKKLGNTILLFSHATVSCPGKHPLVHIRGNLFKKL